MIPNTEIDVDLEIVEEVETGRSYKLLVNKIQGFTDELKALEQAIYKVLSTEMYEYPIYSFNYGIELENLIGEDPIYVKIELKRRITECLLQDNRVNRINDFEFMVIGDELFCNFKVVSIYGEIGIQKAVNI